MTKVAKLRGFPDYEVNTLGEVFSTRTGTKRQLKPSTSTGYAKVGIVNTKGETKNLQIHRMVAMCFIPNPKKLEIVNHIDGNKLNNNLSNLEWVSRGGNGKHYSEKLAPKYAAERKAKKENDAKMRMDILTHAHAACTANPELFHSIFQTVMKG